MKASPTLSTKERSPALTQPKKRKHRPARVLALIGGLLCTSLALASFQNTVVFGDSLSDMGNNTWVSNPQEGFHGAPITNQAPGQAKLLWPNVLVAALKGNLPTAGDPFLASQQTRFRFNPYTDDVNYAYASAETGDRYLNDLDTAQGYPPYDPACTQPGLRDAEHACVPGVILQIKSYLAAVQNHPNPNTRFILWAGGNDFFNDVAKLIASAQGHTAALSRGFTQLAALWEGTAPTPTSPIYSNPIQNLAHAVQLLEQSGVPSSSIYVFNLPNMAKTPAAQAMAKGNKLILEGVAMLSSVYDFALMDRLRLHAPVLLPAHHLFKINRLFQAIQTDKKVDQHYGFTHLTEDCFALGAAPVCQGYVFYNDKHPTFPVEQMISDRFIQPTPQPSKTAYGI